MEKISGLIVTIDVDETLITWVPGKDTYIPHEEHITEVKRHHNRGHKVIVWSAGGEDFAERIVYELNLQNYVTLVMAKPSWSWDDKDPSEWLRICYKGPYVSKT